MNHLRRTLKESLEHYFSFRKWRILLKTYRPVTTTSSYEECSDVNKNVTFKNNEDVPSDHILRCGLRFLKGDIEELKQNIKHRKIELDIEEMLSFQKVYNQLLHKTQLQKHQQKQFTKTLSLMKDPIEKAAAIEEMKLFKQEMKSIQTELHKAKTLLAHSVSHIPNHTHPNVPIGGQENAKLIYTHGVKPEFNFPIQDHVVLGEKLNLFDFKSAAEATRSSFYYLKGPAALLELALIQYTMKKAVNKGYHPIITPDIIKEEIAEGCGFQPRGISTQMYHLNPELHGGLCLSGTAELPLAGMYMNHTLLLKDLPIKLVAFGRCFRAEAGAYGKITRGLYRVHQFSKVELFALTANETGEESNQALDEMMSLQKEIYSELGFHYRVLEMPTEELGAPAYRKYDVEVWMPGREDFGEVTSASNCTDYQSQRLNITYAHHPVYRKGSRRTQLQKYVHTINGTACAIPRTIIALLEHYQQEDGSILLPSVLHPYVGKKIG